ncbi:MAG: hypothetical protein AB1716_20915 [Planctomycetota bacterium]
MADCRAIDFGTVGFHTACERSVQITNTQATPLPALHAGSDCKCLTSLVAAAALEAGAGTAWRIQLEVCSDYLGEAQRHVWLSAGPQGAPLLKLPVRYRVVPAVHVEPSLVPLGIFGHGPVEAEVLINTLSKEPIRLLAVRCRNPLVQAVPSAEVVTADRPAGLRVTVAGAPEGRFQESIEVDTSAPDLRVLRIPVLGECTSAVRCAGRELVFADVPLGTDQARAVAFTCRPGIEIGAVRTSNNVVSLAAVERDGDRVTVSLRPASHLPLGTFQGFLIVETADGSRSRELKLPYRGRVVLPPQSPAVRDTTSAGCASRAAACSQPNGRQAP